MMPSPRRVRGRVISSIIAVIAFAMLLACAPAVHPTRAIRLAALAGSASIAGPHGWPRVLQQSVAAPRDDVSERARERKVAAGIRFEDDRAPHDRAENAQASRSKPKAKPKPKAPPQPRGGRALAALALKYRGYWGGWPCRRADSEIVNGQCKQFVGCLLRVLNDDRRIIGPGYYTGYPEGGAKRVAPWKAKRGDVIQLVRRGRMKDTFRFGMHTAIVLDYKKGGRYLVVDSNYLGNERVRVHWWRPWKQAKRFNLNVTVWRYPER